MTHERVWLTGYGCEVCPLVPFEISMDADGAVIIVHEPGGVMLMPDVDGGAPEVALHPESDDLLDALEWVELKPWTPAWTFSTAWFTAPWPAGSTLWSADADWLFEIAFNTESPDEMIYLQGAFSVDDAPTLDDFGGEDLTESQRGQLEGVHGAVNWVELYYLLAGSRWYQRRYLVPCGDAHVVLVTAQGMKSKVEVFAGAERVVRELHETPDQGTT